MSERCRAGWKMRVALARVLLGRPDVLLMDETDQSPGHRVGSSGWSSFLKSFSGALLMTSHDREFMNRTVSRIAEIDGGEIIAYSGDYDFYERERAIRETNQQAAFARSAVHACARNGALSSGFKTATAAKAGPGAEPDQSARQDRTKSNYRQKRQAGEVSISAFRLDRATRWR